MGKAGTPKDSVDALIKAKRDIKKQYGLQRQAYTGISGAGTINLGGSGKKGSTTNTSFSGYLPTSGGVITGALSFNPKTALMSSGAINIGVENGSIGGIASRIIVTGELVAADDLNTITGAKHAGQILFLQAVETTPITLKHAAVGGNIWIPTLSDYIVTGGEIVMLQYDTVNTVWSAVANFTAAGDITESSTPVVWTGIHSFNGVSTSINSGTIVLGDNTTDNISFGGRIGTSILPISNNLYNLGSSSLEWKDIHIVGTAYLDTIQSLVCSVTSVFSSTGTTSLGDSSTDSINLNGNIDTDVVIDGGKRVRSYDSQEIGLQVTNDSITTGTEGTLQIPWLSGNSSSKAGADTDFGNATACIGINEIGGVPYILVRKSDGSWWGVVTGSIFP